MSNPLFLNAPVCHRCARRAAAVCSLTGREIGDHATAGDCPLHLFPSRGVGDTIAKALHATGIGPLASRAIEAATGKPCGCAERAATLNKLLPYAAPPDH